MSEWTAQNDRELLVIIASTFERVRRNTEYYPAIYAEDLIDNLEQHGYVIRRRSHEEQEEQDLMRIFRVKGV